MTTKIKKKDIQYGDKSFESPKKWDKKDVKVRITTFLDEDLLERIKKEASKQNKKYQSYLNERLREIFMNEESLESRLKKVEDLVLKQSVS